MEVRATVLRPGVRRPSRPDSAWASATLLVPSPLSSSNSVAQSAWGQETLQWLKGSKVGLSVRGRLVFVCSDASGPVWDHPRPGE